VKNKMVTLSYFLFNEFLVKDSHALRRFFLAIKNAFLPWEEILPDGVGERFDRYILYP
jgi:hypothetical protein